MQPASDERRVASSQLTLRLTRLQRGGWSANANSRDGADVDETSFIIAALLCEAFYPGGDRPKALIIRTLLAIGCFENPRVRGSVPRPAT